MQRSQGIVQIDDYGYLNARIRGMKGNLLDEALFQEIQGRGDLTQMVDSLLGSPLAEDLSTALAGASGLEAVEKGLRLHLSRTFRKVHRLSFGVSQVIVGVLLARWDAYNIKTVLRGRHAGRPKEAVVSALIPVGELDEPKLVELLKQPDVKAVIDTLATWLSPFAHTLSRSFPEYQEKGSITVLEEALDRYYFKWALSQVEGDDEDLNLAREVIRGQIDNANLAICLKVVRNRLGSKAASLIPGGHLSPASLKPLIECKELEDMLMELKKLVPGLEGEVSYGEQPMTDMELLLDRLLINRWSNSLKKTHVPISLVLGFMGQKLREFLNLRVIARGKVHRAPIKDWLI
jgi:V/A-type H+-transporting ATPase subunit C